MSTDDLAPVILGGDPGPSLRIGQGIILSWSADDFRNVIDWNGTRLTDVPVAAGVDAFTFAEGQSVIVAAYDPGGRRGGQSWFILGRLVLPGGSELAGAVPPEFSAETLNADTLNADRINLNGQDLREVLQGLQDAIATGDSGSDPEPDPEPAPTNTITRKYAASWSQLYQGDNGKNTFLTGLAQGYWSGTNGNQRSLIGFPSSTIQSDHSGRTITRVRVYLYFEHWLLNSGGTAIIGHHGHSSAPSSFSANTDNVRSADWPKPGGRWVKYNVGVSDWLSGAKRGIAIGPGPSTAALYYGRARAHNESAPPVLEIRSTS